MGSAEVAPDSLVATDLGPNSVAHSEVTDHSLTGDDFALAGGVATHDSASIAAHLCDTFEVATGAVVIGNLVLVNPDFTLADGLSVSARAGTLGRHRDQRLQRDGRA